MSTPDFAAGFPSGVAPETAQLEQTAAALAAAPDAALIARMADAFFSGLPANPATSPGAALPSAPLFVVEPIYSAIPGAPAATPPLTPNHNPGSTAPPFPTAGAARPSAPIYAADPQRASATPGSLTSDAGAPLSLSVPWGPAAISPAIPSPAVPIASASGGAIPHDPDFAALPGRLDIAFPFVPHFDAGALNPQGGAGLPQGPAAIQSSADASYYFLTDNPAATAYRDGVKDTAKGATRSTTEPKPFALDVQTLDLRAVAPQHRSEIPAAQSYGARPFDPHIFRRDFPILQRAGERAPADLAGQCRNHAKTAGGDRSPRPLLQHENSNIHRAAHTLAARSTDAYEVGTREGARLYQRSVGERHHLRARHHRRNQPGRADVGPPQRRPGRRDPGHPSRAPRQHRAVAAARRRKGRQLARGAGRRQRPGHSRRIREAAQSAYPHRRLHAGFERARHHHAGPGDGRDGASPWRARAGRWRTGHFATCRWTCRPSTSTSSFSRVTRCSARPASASCMASPRSRSHATLAGRRQHDRRCHLRENRVPARRRSDSKPAPAISPTR